VFYGLKFDFVFAQPHAHAIAVESGRPVSFAVEPEEAWRTVVLNSWKRLCPSCFDAEAERAGVRYSFANLRSPGATQSAQAQPIEALALPQPAPT
jgi:hypothetical protein